MKTDFQKLTFCLSQTDNRGDTSVTVCLFLTALVLYNISVVCFAIYFKHLKHHTTISNEHNQM